MADIKKYVSLDKLTKYDGKIKGYIAEKDAEVLASAKSYAEGLAPNYDGAGSAATAESNAKAYTDAEVAKANAAAAAADTKAAQGVADAAAAKAAADAAHADVDALEALVGTLPEGTTAKDVVDYVNVKTSGIATDAALEELQGQLSGAQGAIDAIEADYLKAADKTELQGKIDEKAAQSDLDAVSAVANAAATAEALTSEVNRAKGEEARIEGLVSAEATRAAEAEGALDERLVEVETFFKTAADETIDTALDTLVEIQKYLDGEGAVADQMLADIAANAKAIEDMDAAYKAADQTLQGNIDTLSGTVDTKAAQADLESAVERIETAEGDIDKNAEDIAALQAKFGEGEGSVADMIADAVAAEAELRVAGDEAAEASAAAALAAANAAQAAAEAADAKAQTAQDEVDALELVVDTKAAASDVTTLQGKVSTLEGDMTQAKSDIDAVEALAAANQAAIAALQEASATHATKAELQAESERAVAKENSLQAAIDAFVEVSEEEINALFEVRP